MLDDPTPPAETANAKHRRHAPAARDPDQRPGDFPVVAIGASAGGLEACTRFLDALPAAISNMAFILVQHLDPTHEDLLVELLATHTSLTVLQATDGMPIERNHLYIIPPASFLAVGGGALHLQPTQGRRGARLPVDVLLLSMAQEYGPRAICIVLSGTGADGSIGLLAIKQNGGLVIVQDPAEAGYDGMPRSAIATGAADVVLPLAAMPEALLAQAAKSALQTWSNRSVQIADRLPEIIDLLRARTTHDFSLYKPGTLTRRVERRMVIAAIGVDEVDRYVATLRNDPTEADRLAKDLLIHVTGFFRDPAVFDLLAETIVPDLIRRHATDGPLRIWVAGCSTGEEAYSLAMVFQEQILAADSPAAGHVKLQVFASDVDADAVATARDGLYPGAIDADVTPSRLARFFTKEDQSYRVLPELRAMVVFAVQDLLTDPPFSHLDLVSCRNVLIYLSAEAQQRVVALFHFALKKGGILLLGSSEVVGDKAGRFAVISKPARLYRHIGQSRPGDVDFAKGACELIRMPASPIPVAPRSRQAVLTELCQLHALKTHAPATVLINLKHECLFSLGPTERYLRLAPGFATLDVLAMVQEDIRNRLRSAMLRAVQERAPVVVSGGSTSHAGRMLPFDIEVHPVLNDDEALLLIYFIDRPARDALLGASPADGSATAALKQELKTTQAELQSAVRNIEILGEEQKAINENALSVNEEFQSTNEELLTSKEELQSLNEELTALNSQLQETLEQQRTTSNDLQNVLYSTDVATLFLDSDLKIRFFTPATKALFNIIKTDVGRPLNDLRALSTDGALAADAHVVLDTLLPIEREIETPSGVWCRRILPYRTHDDAVEGVVITFTDISGRKHSAAALVAAKRDAEVANAAKSRFLAAASHDLRQPLQTLALLHGLLANRVEGSASQKLIARLDDTVGSMSSMLNTLLDINQIEAGVVRAEITDFRINDLLDRLRDAFTDHAQGQGLALRVMPCRAIVRSDPRLLKQMLRNLVSNALKYTHTGKILLGCRRHGALLRIEVWDTGIGIPDGALSAIFDEYHQIDNAAHERNRGLGLGLAIVQRLGALLHHRVRVHSRAGKGSVFSIEVPVLPGDGAGLPQPPWLARRDLEVQHPAADAHRTGTILVVEDDTEVRELLTLMLSNEGHHVVAAPDGPAALGLVARGVIRPDLILTDYNLPSGMNGLAVAAKFREALGPELPVIILTGDISTEALSAIAARHCPQLNKPVKPAELMQAIQERLPRSSLAPQVRLKQAPSPARQPDTHVIFIVDDDPNIRGSVRLLLEEDGRTVQDFPTSEAFLAAYHSGSDGCLLIDAYLPGMGGLELLKRLRAAGDPLPAIMITGSSDVPMAVQAMKAGAADFIEKPIAAADLLARVERALERSEDSSKTMAWQTSASEHIADLTPRQHQIMDLVLAGHPSKNIAADLGISQRTVENHRASIMRKTDTKSLPALARLALAASVTASTGAIGTGSAAAASASKMEAE
jgi:two-component system CheB/CheR fusion protein